MHTIVYALVAGVVQGLTEFLPISSSGHLVVLHEVLGFDFIDNLTFDVVLHWGTLFALLIFFKQDIIKYLQAFFQSFFHWNIVGDIQQRLAWFLVVGTIPAVLAGLFFEAQIESVFRSTTVVAVMLIAIGGLLYFADRFSRRTDSLEQLGFGGAVLIGVAQALALVPGVSRSGITIIAGLSQKLKREAAARFSFLLSIPIVFGAGLKKMFDLANEQVLVSADVTLLIIGFLASLLTGYFCIKYFLRFLQRHSLKIFVYYRIVLGIIILFWLYW
jgi:undecaprenyl-diphosphatase